MPIMARTDIKNGNTGGHLSNYLRLLIINLLLLNNPVRISAAGKTVSALYYNCSDCGKTMKCPEPYMEI
jgi:hypothetical protein